MPPFLEDLGDFILDQALHHSGIGEFLERQMGVGAGQSRQTPRTVKATVRQAKAPSLIGRKKPKKNPGSKKRRRNPVVVEAVEPVAADEDGPVIDLVPVNGVWQARGHREEPRR